MASQDTAQTSRLEAREKAFADVKQLTAPYVPNDASNNKAYEIHSFQPFPSSGPSSMFSSRGTALGQGPIGDSAMSHNVLMPSKSPKSVEIGETYFRRMTPIKANADMDQDIEARDFNQTAALPLRSQLLL